MVTKEALQQLLEKCITLAVDEAQKEIADSLPAQFYLELGAFGQQGKELSSVPSSLSERSKHYKK